MSKAVKSLTKGVKKLAPIALEAGAAYATGGASLAMTQGASLGYGPGTSTGAMIGMAGGGYAAFGGGWGNSPAGQYFSGGSSGEGNGYGGGGTGAMSHGGGMGGTGAMSNLFNGGGSNGFDWGAMAMAGLDAYGSYEAGQAAEEGAAAAAAIANPFADHRGKYADRLNELYDDPNSITKDPAYKFRMEQGTKAINRSSAASGHRLSGNVLYELQEHGQGLASQMRQEEISNLTTLSGASIAPNGLGYTAGAGGYNIQGIQEGLGTMGHAMGYGPGNRQPPINSGGWRAPPTSGGGSSPSKSNYKPSHLTRGSMGNDGGR